MLKTKYMKHYTSHKTMNLQSMHILLQNILKKTTVDSNYRNTIFTMSIRNHSLLVQVKEMGCCVDVVYHVDGTCLWVAEVWCLSLCICVSLVGELLLLRTGWWCILQLPGYSVVPLWSGRCLGGHGERSSWSCCASLPGGWWCGVPLSGSGSMKNGFLQPTILSHSR